MSVFELKEKITSAIFKAVKEHGVSVDQIVLDHPEVESFGDYSCNIAMRLSKQLKKNPIEIANTVKDSLYRLQTTDYRLIIDKVDVVKPGFINFWIKKEFLWKMAVENYEFPKTGRKIMVEFTDPNPFKEFHIGHLYSNTVGETLARLHEILGHEVRRACYQGDVGMHVSKSIWGILLSCHSREGGNLCNNLLKLEKQSLEERIKFLGECYALGAAKYEEDEKAKEEINALNKKIYEHDKDIEELYQVGRTWSLLYFEKIYERLGMKLKENGKCFDYYYFESAASEKGLKIVNEYLERGIFEKSEGAVIFPGKKYGLHTLVFINSAGLPTYEAKELGLAPAKYEDFSYDLSVIVTGNEINEYFKVLMKALSLISPELEKKTVHIGHGMVRLPEGKMSSRTGKVITGEWLLDEVKKKVKENYKSDNETSEKIGVAAVKYALLKSGIGHDVIFDFGKSISLEGNSGPYLQYTLVRTMSVLTKIRNTKYEIRNKDLNSKFQILNSEELSLLRTLYKFPEVIKSAADNYAPNLLCNYLYDLAQKFNLFYGKHRIIDREKVERPARNPAPNTSYSGARINETRLFLTVKTGEVLKKGMEILNLPVVDKM